MSLTVDCAVTERAGRSFIIGLQVTRRAGVFQDEKKNAGLRCNRAPLSNQSSRRLDLDDDASRRGAIEFGQQRNQVNGESATEPAL